MTNRLVGQFRRSSINRLSSLGRVDCRNAVAVKSASKAGFVACPPALVATVASSQTLQQNLYQIALAQAQASLAERRQQRSAAYRWN